MERTKIPTVTPAPSQVVLTKRKRTDDAKDIEVSPPLKIKDRTRKQAASAGYHFGCYVKDCMDVARTPVDFATFVAAMPADDLILALPKHSLSILRAAEASKAIDIKLAVDIIKNLPSDVQHTSPKLSTQLNTMMNNMHLRLKSDDQHLKEYILKTQEHLQIVQSSQEMLQRYGSEEEKKLQERVFDSVSDRLEKLQKLQALFGDD